MNILLGPGGSGMGGLGCECDLAGLKGLGSLGALGLDPPPVPPPLTPEQQAAVDAQILHAQQLWMAQAMDQRRYHDANNQEFRYLAGQTALAAEQDAAQAKDWAKWAMVGAGVVVVLALVLSKK